MIKLQFDDRGYLVPYKRIKITLDEFEEFFVKEFGENSIRSEIFERYKKYILDFSEKVSPKFIHWIDGSFVTTKKRPGDIDFVSLIEHPIYEIHRNLIDTNFRLSGGKENYDVDAYTLEILPPEHKRYSIFKIDLVYWDSWFSKTKQNWQKKRFRKGYVEIEFDG